MKCPVASFEMGLCVRYDFGQPVLRCWRICVVCLALELIGSWVVVGFSVSMEAYG